MTHKHTLLWLLSLVLLPNFLIGCNSTTTTRASSPDNAIVWADNFNDGNTEGWEAGSDIEGDEYFVRAGILTFGDNGGDISHPSDVTVGTWSADVFIPSKDGVTTDMTFMGAEIAPGQFRTVWLVIENIPQTTIRLQQFDGSAVTLQTKAVKGSQRLSGWHHIDITRDRKGNVKVFLDRELVIDSYVYFPYVSQYFYFASYSQGPALKSIVVRKDVLDLAKDQE